MKKRWHVLKGLIEENGYRVFVEVGVYAGDTSSFLLRVIKRKNFRIFGVDPYVEYKGYRSPNIDYIKGMAYRGCFTDPRCCHIEKFSVDAVNDFDEVDMVFIDANHKYNWIWQDINLWWAKVRKGGILSGHDYWSVKGGRNRDVRKAVNRFVYLNKLELNTEDDGVWWIKKWE